MSRTSEPSAPSEALKREIKKAERERLETSLLFQIRAAGLPEPEREVRLVKERQWRYDFVWKRQRVIAECEGGTWTGGRHSRGKGFVEDCLKYNQASLLGYRIFRFTGDLIEQGLAVLTLRQVLEEEAPGG